MMNRLIRNLLSLCLVVWGSIGLWAQQVSIQGRLDRAEIKTGEQAAIDLIIRTNDLPRTKFYLKQKPSEGDPYTVIEFGALDTIDLDGSLKEITARLLITSFDSTLITISPIVVETPSGQAETEPMALKVTQPEVDAQHPNNFRDIKAPWDLSLGVWDWLLLLLTNWVLWLVIAVCLVAYLIYRWVSRKPKEKQEHLREVSLWVQLQQRLKVLEHIELREQEDFKIYYSELVSVIKAGLDQCFGWDSLEMTTRELRHSIRQEQALVHWIEPLEGILTEADLSKFAKAVPPLEVASEALTQSRLLLEELRKKHQHKVMLELLKQQASPK